MVSLWETEQRHEEDAVLEGYYNEAKKTSLYRYPGRSLNVVAQGVSRLGLPRNEKGSPVAYTGMTWTPFRPSDDECKYGYLVPANVRKLLWLWMTSALPAFVS